MADNKLILALPKGRISKECIPLLEKAGIRPEDEFYNQESRVLQFTTNKKNLDIIRVRSFDVVTFVGYGAADIGIAGSDVLDEFDHKEVYAPIDLKIASCRLAIAEKKELASKDNPEKWSHIHVATKYPNITRQYFAGRGVQAECIKLNGAMELAPNLGLCRYIVDLVDSGKTLRDNGLKEVEKIADVSSYLIMNRTSYKTCSKEISNIIDAIKEAVSG